jgi:hypothetical protein
MKCLALISTGFHDSRLNPGRVAGGLLQNVKGWTVIPKEAEFFSARSGSTARSFPIFGGNNNQGLLLEGCRFGVQTFHKHGVKTMMWIAFGAGIMVGTVVGVVVVALCRMMWRDGEHRSFSGHPDCQYGSFQSPVPFKDTR